MNTKIFVFSGTGNSLMIAREVARDLGNTEKIGIIFPIYCYGIPNMVKEFVRKLKGLKEKKYIFALTTFKAQPGNALGQLDDELKRYNLKISFGTNIMMPGNNIIYYELEDKKIQQYKIQLWNERRDKIITTIKNNEIKEIKRFGFFQSVIGGRIIYKIMSRRFYKLDHNFYINHKCIGCGKCSKICPAENITLNRGEPIWNNSCELCTACLNLCPMDAIEYGENTIGRKRYRHKDLFKSKK